MSDRIYPCRACGVMRTKEEGGAIFTVCDACWDIWRLGNKKSDDATITELRAQVDTLAKAWRKAEDENDELRAEVERLTRIIREAGFPRVLIPLDVSMREWKDRAELVETDLAKARDIIKAFMRGASLEPPGLFERAAALLAKVKL